MDGDDYFETYINVPVGYAPDEQRSEAMTPGSNSATGGKTKTRKARKSRKRNRSRRKRQSDRSTRRTRRYRKRK